MARRLNVVQVNHNLCNVLHALRIAMSLGLAAFNDTLAAVLVVSLKVERALQAQDVQQMLALVRIGVASQCAKVLAVLLHKPFRLGAVHNVLEGFFGERKQV